MSEKKQFKVGDEVQIWDWMDIRYRIGKIVSERNGLFTVEGKNWSFRDVSPSELIRPLENF